MLRFFQYFTAGTALASAAAYSCCFVVHPGECAVIYNRLSGIKEKTLTEGLQFRILGLEEPKLFDVRLRPRVLQTVTGTKDLQMVNVRLRVLFRPEAEKLPEIYRNLGVDYDERVLPSISNEILKAVVAEYQAEELIVKRQQVSERIRDLMAKKVGEFHLILEDLSLMDIHFGKEFMAAVESKQVAQQEAERFKFVVMENEQKKKAAVIQAEGEATAAKLVSTALATFGSGMLELRKIEASKDIAINLTSSPNVHFVPQAGMLLNVKATA